MIGCKIPLLSHKLPKEQSLIAMGAGVDVQGGAGAYYRSPLGKKEFKAEFDLEWDDTNNPTGQRGSSYEANRIAMVLAKTLFMKILLTF